MSKQSFSLLEAVITAGALVTSSAAVFIAWDQANTMRQDQHANVFPAIQIDEINDHSNSGLTVGFTIENAGVGPAFLQYGRLLKGERPLTGYEEVTGEVPPRVELNFRQLTGRVLAPGVAKNAMTMSWRGVVLPQQMINEVYASTDDMTLEVCYCSTKDRCWISRSDERVHPQRVEVCKIPNQGLF